MRFSVKNIQQHIKIQQDKFSLRFFMNQQQQKKINVNSHLNRTKWYTNGFFSSNNIILM